MLYAAMPLLCFCCICKACFCSVSLVLKLTELTYIEADVGEGQV